MRFTIAVVGAIITTVAVASPITSPSSPLSRRQDPPVVRAGIAKAGACPMNCWNEAAVMAGCDPNTDDNCLCGPFFDAVTSCSAATCSIGENLAALDLLNPACE